MKVKRRREAEVTPLCLEKDSDLHPQKSSELVHNTEHLPEYSHANTNKQTNTGGTRRWTWRAVDLGVEPYILTMATGTLLHFHLLIEIAATKKKKHK